MCFLFVCFLADKKKENGKTTACVALKTNKNRTLSHDKSSVSFLFFFFLNTRRGGRKSTIFFFFFFLPCFVSHILVQAYLSAVVVNMFYVEVTLVMSALVKELQLTTKDVCWLSKKGYT